MPPRTTRATKVLKENIDIVKKSNVISTGRVTKTSRKALADKTNSLSDDNDSIDIPIKISKKALKNKSTAFKENNEARPRRERRLPPRYVENQILKELSRNKNISSKENSLTAKMKTALKKPPLKDISFKTLQDINSSTEREENLPSSLQEKLSNKVTSQSTKTFKKVDKQVPITKFLTKDETRPKRPCRVQSEVENNNKSPKVLSPFKTPPKADDSLIANRPKRICRLPSRFEDHSISPTKFIPVQPCHASTPILHKTIKIVNKNASNVSVEKRKDDKKEKIINHPIRKPANSKLTEIATISNTSKSPDTNNNGKKKVLRHKKVTNKTKSETIQASPKNKIKAFAGRLLETSVSFKVLEDRDSNAKRLDVYEFTFDPNEEPPPKKKRKKPAKKRPAKPKMVIFQSNYDNNVSKALEKLKSKVKPSQTTNSIQCNIKSMETLAEGHAKSIENQAMTSQNYVKSMQNANILADGEQNTLPIAKPAINGNISQNNYSASITPAIPAINESINSIHASNYASMRVEDIAADFEFSENHDDINYSPVNSPQPQPNPDHETVPEVPEANKDPVNNKDPLNLQDDVSFFEEPPIASSSMNVSVRHPLASPWRVEFGSLPMKWHNNTYVKANMTPAVESSFVNSEVAKTKHIYTNIVSEEPLPEIFENSAPALKQTSIISFIKEVAERKANKKKKRLQTPTKVISESSTATASIASKSPKKAKISITPNTSENMDNTSKDKENSTDSSNKSLSPEKKKKGKDCTYFGFDESENVDQENVSPIKVNPNPKRKLRSRNVLQQLNTQSVPTRAAMPISAKTKLTSSEVVEQLYDQLKSAEDAQFPETETAKEPADNTVTRNEDDPSWCEDNEDSQSVHLFEDIAVVHHLKPHRKSYGKAKKITFQRSANSVDSDSQPIRPEAESSNEDDLADLSFHLPNVKQTNKRTKKAKPKKQLTKKEEKEVEEWAADFNSMCEDIDEFPLLVE